MAPRPKAQPDSGWDARYFLGSVLRTAAMLAGVLASLLAPSRDWAWPAAWAVVLLPVALCLLPTACFLARHNPTLLRERDRMTRNEGTADFDRAIVPFLVVATFARYAAAALQHARDAAQQPQAAPPAAGLLSSPAMAAALALDAASLCLQTWAITSNRFFSSVVRIQIDRGHAVCSSGPYARLRHPGYTAFSLQGVAEAVLLRSSWCMALALAKAAALVMRTCKEDAFLQANLPGYAAYAAHTARYRLLPGVW